MNKKTISTMTDQELADEYRYYISKARPFRQELIDRGFSFLSKRPLFHDVETIRIIKPTVGNL